MSSPTVSPGSAPGPTPSSPVVYSRRLRDYARQGTTEQLLAPLSRRLFELTSGRCGRLRVDGRRWGRLVRLAYLLGYDEGVQTDRFAQVTHPRTSEIMTQHGHAFDKGLRASYTGLRGRTRSAALRAAVRAPAVAMAWAALVVLVVFCVDLVLNEPLVSRLADVSPVAVHVVSAGIALALVLVGHFSVHHTPPGRRAVVRTRLVVVAVVSLAALIGLGGFLRVHGAVQVDTTPALDATGPSLWSSSWPVLVAWGAMTGLMSMTFALSSLTSLHLQTVVERLQPHGPEVGQQLINASHVEETIERLVAHVHALNRELVQANLAGFCVGAHPDLADRVHAFDPERPHLAPELGALEAAPQHVQPGNH